jgi:hypothetical protein
MLPPPLGIGHLGQFEQWGSLVELQVTPEFR